MPIRGASAPAGGALGRDTELGQIGAWLAPGAAPAPAGPRLVLVIEGEPGIGKTTLWTEATGRARAAGWHVLSCRPAASDAGLPHVGLADLLRSVPDDAFARLPAPQRRALGVALLREEAGGIDLDPRAVGTGLTALLGLIASDGPLMLAVDDAQWLDPASARALGFALRRLDDRQLRLVTAVRTEGPAGQRTGAFAAVEASLDRQTITRIEVGPLSVAAIHQMFARTLGSSFARPVLVRIHRAAGGNPFYALEIGREVQRLGVPPPSQPLPIPGDHRDLALLRLQRLPRATRDVLAGWPRWPGRPPPTWTWTRLRPRSWPASSGCAPAAGPSSPIRCSRRPCTPRSPRPAAAGCTATSRSGPPARRNGPAIWPWRPTALTRPPRPPWTRRPRPRRRTEPPTWPWN